MSSKIREAEKRRERAERQEREEIERNQAARDFHQRFGELEETLSRLGIDPHLLADYINELPNRGF